MEALSREFRIGCPWELLYGDDLVIVAESLEELKSRLKNWKSGLEEKGIKVNVGKIKVLCSRHDATKSKITSVKHPCGVCMKGVGANSILCLGCRKWVHRRCSGIKGSLRSCSLLFIIVMEALSREFRIGCPWELLYGDDLVIVAESLEELKSRSKNWKSGLEEKGIKVNVGKIKVLCSRHDATKSKITSVKHPCGVCMKGVGANSILCLGCRKWVHRRCSGIKGSLRSCGDFICKTCSTITGYTNPSPTSISVGSEELEVISEFWYLGDVIGQAGGCTDAVTAHIGSAWKAFHELLPILTNRGISLANRGKVFKACVRTVLLYGSETWPISTEDLARIKKCDHAMIRWICIVKIEQKLSTEVLRKRIFVEHIEDVLRWNRLRLFGHLHRQDDTSWTKEIMNFDVDGPTPRSRPKLRWKDVVNADLRKKQLNMALASGRSKWRNAIRPVTQQNALQPTMSRKRRGNDQ